MEKKKLMKTGNMKTGFRFKEEDQLKKFKYLLSAVIFSLMLILTANPLQGADMTGKWGVGLHGGVYKLGLTDHSDIWTLGWLANADVKYGMSHKVSFGVEGNWMQTYLANRTGSEGAGLTFDKVKDGPRQRAFVIGLLGEYHFKPEKKWSPFVSAGSGLYIWRWADRNWKTLTSADPSLVGTGIPRTDLTDTCCYYLRDQELYVMAGLGMEFFPTQSLSFELGTKFRYLTHLFTNFRDNRDIVGTDPGQLDLPRLITEVYAGLTLHFGGEKECPQISCAASGDPKSGSPSLRVQFDGSATGGCSPYTYSWEFGDGGSSTDPKPQHVYDTTGNYTARLTVTDSKGNRCQESVSSIKVEKVGCPPLACKASVDPDEGAAPLTVQFSVSVSGGCPPYTYSWDIGEGGSSTEQNPSHLVEHEGKYTAHLTVTDSKENRCQESISYEAFAEVLPTPEKPIVLHNVKFEFDKSRLTVKADSLLDLVAISLKRRPDVKIEIVGHCDWIGTEAYNQKLSIQRAEAVRDYLIRNGVKAENLTFKGYGETQPMADNRTDAGRALNRRVELKRIQ